MNDGMLHLCCNFPTCIQKATADNPTPDGVRTLTKMNLVKSLPMVPAAIHKMHTKPIIL